MEQEQIREIIVREIAKTERLIKEYREMSGPVEPDDAIGRITRMDAINNKSVTESSLRHAEEKLKNLKDPEKGLGLKSWMATWVFKKLSPQDKHQQFHLFLFQIQEKIYSSFFQYQVQKQKRSFLCLLCMHILMLS